MDYLNRFAPAKLIVVLPQTAHVAASHYCLQGTTESSMTIPLFLGSVYNVVVAVIATFASSAVRAAMFLPNLWRIDPDKSEIIRVTGCKIVRIFRHSVCLHRAARPVLNIIHGKLLNWDARPNQSAMLVTSKEYAVRARRRLSIHFLARREQGLSLSGNYRRVGIRTGSSTAQGIDFSDMLPGINREAAILDF